MTNEEIKQIEVEEIIQRKKAEEIEIDARKLAESAHTYGVDYAAPTIAYVIRSFLKQAYDEAIKAQCYFCREGYAVVPDEIDRPAHSVERMEGSGEYIFVECASSEIHALKDALEAVSQ
jgi:hypothetical protein